MRLETIRDREGFDALARQGWDDLVRAMPRPSPFLLHGWLDQWLRHFGGESDLRVHAAFGDSGLAAALPLVVSRRRGLRIAEFVGGAEAALADLMLGPGAQNGVAAELAGQALESDHHYADLAGLPGGSLLASTLDLELIERVESPVLDLQAGWEAVYREKTTSKKRNLHSRRRKQLAELGKVDVALARTADELEAALADAFRLHDLRWQGRPDQSTFGTALGRRFVVAAFRDLAEQDVPRIVMLRVDGRAIAFHSYLAFCGTMYVHRLAFDPSLAKYSPGLVNTLDALEAASAEGLTRVEFLGGGERYKLELADRLEPMYEGLGLGRGLAGRAAVTARVAQIRTRLRLKRSPFFNKLYYEGLAPVRRLVRR